MQEEISQQKKWMIKKWKIGQIQEKIGHTEEEIGQIKEENRQ